MCQSMLYSWTLTFNFIQVLSLENSVSKCMKKRLDILLFTRA